MKAPIESRPYLSLDATGAITRHKLVRGEDTVMKVPTDRLRCDRCGWETSARADKPLTHRVCSCGGDLEIIESIIPIGGVTPMPEPLNEAQKNSMNGKPTTDSQRGFLAKLGHVGEVPTDRGDASRLIDALLAARRDGGR
jgi:hypothetical protein